MHPLELLFMMGTASWQAYVVTGILFFLALRHHSLIFVGLSVFTFTCGYRAARPVEPISQSCLSSLLYQCLHAPSSSTDALSSSTGVWYTSNPFVDRCVATVGELALLTALWCFCRHRGGMEGNISIVYGCLAVAAQGLAWMTVRFRSSVWTMAEYALWLLLSILFACQVKDPTGGEQLLLLVLVGFFAYVLTTEMKRYWSMHRSALEAPTYTGMLSCDSSLPSDLTWDSEIWWLRVYFIYAPLAVLLFGVFIVRPMVPFKT
jgi:hypothetical protein